MIEAYADSGAGPILFIGLSRENTQRLHDDQPIPIDVAAKLQGRQLAQVVLFAGETEDECEAYLRAAVEQTGGTWQPMEHR
jgi:hypothetical protein